MTATNYPNISDDFGSWDTNTSTISAEYHDEHEDEAWQDELEDNDSSAHTSDGVDQPNTTKNVRIHDTASQRRRKAPIGINVRARRPSQSRLPGLGITATKVRARRESIITSDQVAAHAESGAIFVFHYIFDILKSVIMMLKTPLKVVLFFWLLSFLGDRILLEVRKTVSPFCWIPGINLSAVCRPIDLSSDNSKTKWADFERLEDTQSQAFHTVLVESFGNSALALDIKRAEMATSDLASLVRVSNLKMKKPIEDQLRDFGKLAALTADGLQTLAAKVNGAFDRVIAINDHAMATIEQARSQEPAPWPFGALMRPNAKEEIQIVLNTVFDQALAVLSFNLRDLIIVAELNLARLKELEESLTTLHTFATDSGVQTSADKEQVLGEIWTWLGGNRHELQIFEENFDLLRHIGEYRRQARAHVVLARQTLLNMQATMEDMRQRAADPVLMGPAIPVEVHIKSIRMALTRMENSRLLAREVEEKAYNRAYRRV